MSEVLTEEEFRRAFDEIASRPFVLEYQRAPHSPRCRAVQTQEWRDCDCSTAGWLMQFGYYTRLVAAEMARLFEAADRARCALLRQATHFELLDMGDEE